MNNKGELHMTDGYALIEINHLGEGRLKELHYFDFRLENVCFDDAEGVEQLVDQLPKDSKDMLVMCIFKYKCNCSQNWEGEVDCEELFDLVSHTTVKSNYQDFYREMVTEEIIQHLDFLDLDIPNFIDCDEEYRIKGEYFQELVAYWEEFYDEDFELKKENQPVIIQDGQDISFFIQRLHNPNQKILQAMDIGNSRICYLWNNGDNREIKEAEQEEIMRMIAEGTTNGHISYQNDFSDQVHKGSWTLVRK